MEETYYKSSGKAPIGGVLFAIIAGVCASVILAIVYIALQWFIPIVYFNFLITFGLAYGLFYVLDVLLKSEKLEIGVLHYYLLSSALWLRIMPNGAYLSP